MAVWRRLAHGRALRRAVRREPAVAERVNAIFADRAPGDLELGRRGKRDPLQGMRMWPGLALAETRMEHVLRRRSHSFWAITSAGKHLLDDR
jgi:hypothetical protein